MPPTAGDPPVSPPSASVPAFGIRSGEERAELERAARSSLDELLVELDLLSEEVQRLCRIVRDADRHAKAAYEEGYRDGRRDTRDLGPSE